jgi:hypothetical protein
VILFGFQKYMWRGRQSSDVSVKLFSPSGKPYSNPGLCPVPQTRRTSCTGLEAAIRGVHKLVNNADPTGMYLVFGDGSTPLISVAQMVRRDSSEQGTCDAAGAA